MRMSWTALVAAVASASQEDQAPQPADAPAAEGAPATDRIRMQPLPGMTADPIDVRPIDSFDYGNLENTGKWASTHTYEDNVQKLVVELDETEEHARQLRLEVVEKDNFLEGLSKREHILRLDMADHRKALAMLSAHIQAVEARIERLKKEREIDLVMAQRDKYRTARDVVENKYQASHQVIDALGTRLSRLESGAKSDLEAEAGALRRSLQPDVAAGVADDPDAVRAVTESAGLATDGMDMLQAFLQVRGSQALRGHSNE